MMRNLPFAVTGAALLVGAACGGPAWLGDAPCAAGSVQSCYSGPPETRGVGVCASGLTRCREDGTGWGPCEGEVTPAAESCLTPGDEDCDGAADEAGEGCACAPGVTEPCYEGPPGTQGVGPCQAGLRACNAQGDGWGACTGQVTPQPETCGTTADDDCDGMANEEGDGCLCAPGSQLPCYDGPDGTEGVGTCAAGIATCAADGTAYGPCEGEVTPSPDGCATPFDEDCDGVSICTGASLWSRRFGAGGSETVAMATGPNAHIALGGAFDGTIDFGGGPLSGNSYLAVLDGSGAHRWSRSFAPTAPGLHVEVRDVAIAPDGRTLAAGSFDGSLQIGAHWLHSVGGWDAFVAVFDAEGTATWARSFGGEGPDGAQAVAVDEGGRIALFGVFTGTLDAGGGVLLPSAGLSDHFLLVLEAQGDVSWAKGYGDPEDQSGFGHAAFDAAGNVVLAVRNAGGSLDFGGGPLSGGLHVAKLDPFGAHLWSKVFGPSAVFDLAVDAAGYVVLTGALSGPTDFGGGPMTVAGGAEDASDVFVAKLDPSGSHVWSAQYGGPGSQLGLGVGVNEADEIVLTGGFSAPFDLGGGTLLVSAAWDLFFAKLGPDGQHIWSRRAGEGGDQLGMDIAPIPGSAGLVVAGLFHGEIDLGLGPLASAGQADVFVVRVDP